MKLILSAFCSLCVLSASGQEVDPNNNPREVKPIFITRATVAEAGGFPYKITKPGYYKLDGNLVAPLDTPAILVQSNGAEA